MTIEDLLNNDIDIQKELEHLKGDLIKPWKEACIDLNKKLEIADLKIIELERKLKEYENDNN